MKNHKHLFLDFIYIVVSIIVAVFLVKGGALDFVANSNNHVWASFFSGIFFTSAFTIAPSSAVIGVLTLKTSPLLIAFFGAIGAVLGDLIIFTFIRDRFADDIIHLVGPNKKKFLHAIHLRLFRWIIPFVGAIIIASPLPDELGLFLLGISKTKTKLLIPISFVMNFVGILLVSLVARAIE